MFLINSYVTMLISLLIPAHGQLSNVEHMDRDLILLILLIWGKIPYWLAACKAVWPGHPPNLEILKLVTNSACHEMVFERYIFSSQSAGQ